MKKANLLLILILVINIALRVPSLFDPVSYGDECIYLTLGQAFNKGLVFYKDIHDNKPPLLYLVASLAQGDLFWLRIITILWNTINVWLIYKLATRWLKTNWAGVVAAFLFSIFSLLPEGRVANGEIYMIMPATLGLLIATEAWENKKNNYWFFSGLAFSIAFLFKIPIAFDFVGLLLAFFVLTQKKWWDIGKVFVDKRVYLALLGFLLPIVLSVAYYTAHGAFTPYVRSALMQNIGYLSSWKGSNVGLYVRAVILIIMLIIIYFRRRQLGSAFFIPAVIALCGLYGVFLSERPYPHYLLEIAPWTALLLTTVIWQKKFWQIAITLLLVCLTVIGVKKYNFWWYPNLPYYRNFIKYVAHQLNQEQYFRLFGGDKVINDYLIAQYLKQQTSPNDRVFIWGDGVCIYALAHRLPPGRYTVNYHVFDFDGFDETITAIKQHQPKYIIKLTSESRDFTDLDKVIKSFYIKVTAIGEALLYRRSF